MPFLSIECKYLIRRLSYHKTWCCEWQVWPVHSLTMAIGVTYKAIRLMVSLVLEEVTLKSWRGKQRRGINFENTAKEYKRWSEISPRELGAGIAQWLERRTRDWKVAGSNPCWNGGRIFFSRVDFLCWLLFRYPFHPRVTTVARKKSRSFCQKCRWQVTAKHAYTLRIEPCFGIGHNLSLICQMTSEDIKHQLNNNSPRELQREQQRWFRFRDSSGQLRLGFRLS